VLYVTEGEGYHYVDFKKYHLKAGDVMVIKKNQVHHYVVSDQLKGYVVHINEPFLLSQNDYLGTVFFEMLNKLNQGNLISVNSTDSTNRKLIDLIYNEYNQNNKENIPLLKSLFASFVVSIGANIKVEKAFSTSEMSLFNDYQALVEKVFTKHLKLNYYERELGVSKKTINLVTRKVVDLSAKEFINQRLLLEIKRYLSSTDLLIYEISELLGFDEPANMTNFFKKLQGQSPKIFRKSN
jgi:AraC-like DNA-binding protein